MSSAISLQRCRQSRHGRRATQRGSTRVPAPSPRRPDLPADSLAESTWNQDRARAVCAAMTARQHRRWLTIVLIAIAGLALGGCTTAGGLPPESRSTAPSASEPAAPPSSPAIDLPADKPTTGGGSDGSTGRGIGIAPPAAVDPVKPGVGQPTLVRPKGGQKDPRPVAPSRLETSIDDRHVLVKVTWWSGVAPCSVLDSVRVERSGSD